MPRPESGGRGWAWIRSRRGCRPDLRVTDGAEATAGPLIPGPAVQFRRRPLSAGQNAVNTAHSALRAPGERANAELKNWRILRKIRSSPAHATLLVNAVQTLILVD